MSGASFWKVWAGAVIGGAVGGAVVSIWNQCTDHMVDRRFIQDERPELREDAELLLRQEYF